MDMQLSIGIGPNVRCAASMRPRALRVHTVNAPRLIGSTMLKKHVRLALLGVPIDNVTMDEAVVAIDKYIIAGQFRQIATANVDFLMRAIQDEELMEVLQRCSLVVSDGMPLVWASHVLRTPLRERVTGADLVPKLAELAARKQYTFFFLGAKDSHSKAAAEWLERTFPGAKVVGRYSPPVTSLEEMDHEAILTRIEACSPDILLVAFGNPKQEKWIARHRDRLKVPACIGVGATLDFLSGKHPRAPLWMQDHGFEWLHRFYQEPARLGKRYSSNAAGLLRHMSVQLFAMSTQPRSRQDLVVTHQWFNDTAVVSVIGKFSGDAVSEFQRLLEAVQGTHCPVIVNLDATESIGADALGSLISLSDRMRIDGRELWLAGIRPSVRRVLRAAFLERRFRLAPKVSEAIRRIDLTTTQKSLPHGA